MTMRMRPTADPRAPGIYQTFDSVAPPPLTIANTRITGFVGTSQRATDAIVETCRQLLPPYAVPSAIHRVEDWPTNSSGKTDYSRLRQIVETTPCPRT